MKALFGRSLRVVLAAWIVQRDVPAFYLQEAQDAMRTFGEAPSGVAQELRKFVKYGLLNESPDLRRVYFTPTDSPLWRAFHAIVAAVEEMQGHASAIATPQRKTAPEAAPKLR